MAADKYNILGRRKPYAALGARDIARADDGQLAAFAVQYAQEHQFGPVTTPGRAALAPRGAILDSGPGRPDPANDVRVSMDRRRRLALSLKHRHTESSRRRAAQRLMAAWGYGLGPQA